MLSLSNFTSIATNDPTQTTRKRDLTSAEDSNATVDIVKRQQTTHSSLDQPDTPYSSPKCEHSLVEDDNTTVQVTKRQKQVIQSVKDHADIVEQVDKAVATSSPNKTALVLTISSSDECHVKAAAETSNQDKTQIPSTTASSSQVSCDQEDPGLPKPELPIDVWELILIQHGHFSTCELIELALSSKAMYSMVTSLPIWYHIVKTAGLHQYQESTTPFSLVHKHRDRICDQCYKWTDVPFSGPEAALPIFRKDTECYVKMCLSCRQHYFQRHPESPIPIEHCVEKNRCSRDFCKDLFDLSDQDMDQILPCNYGDAQFPHYHFWDVLPYARHVYGGDVGIDRTLHRTRTTAYEHFVTVHVPRMNRETALFDKLRSEGLGISTASDEIREYCMYGQTSNLDQTITTMKDLVDLIITREDRLCELLQSFRYRHIATKIDLDQKSFNDYIMYGIPSTIDQLWDELCCTSLWTTINKSSSS